MAKLLDTFGAEVDYRKKRDRDEWRMLRVAVARSAAERRYD